MTSKDVERYLGILILSSVTSVNSIRDMWSPALGIELVKETMPIATFETLRSILHLNDNSKQKGPTDPDRDRLYKLRPVIDSLNNKFLSIPMRPTLAIDEQICATKTRHYLRQYNPRKPHKWGFKLFVICDDHGFAHKFEIYCGNEPLKLDNEPELGATGNIVVRLSREVPRDVNYIIFCDNYYSSIPLFSYLASNGIHMIGTFRKDRLPNLPFPEKKEKGPRGSYKEHITEENGQRISVVTWNDNDIVTIGSTLCGALPTSEVKRYNRKEKKFIDIQCPKIVRVYNKHMGGVDLMDANIGRHHIRIKSKKWYFRLFYHLLDMAVINSWILYCAVSGNSITQKAYRVDLATTMCKLGVLDTQKRGRPSSSPREQLQAKRMKASMAIRPPIDVKKDKTDHWPIWDAKRNRCKMEGCTAKTSVKCTKCNLNLCFHAGKNCFKDYHM